MLDCYYCLSFGLGIISSIHVSIVQVLQFFHFCAMTFPSQSLFSMPEYVLQHLPTLHSFNFYFPCLFVYLYMALTRLFHISKSTFFVYSHVSVKCLPLLTYWDGTEHHHKNYLSSLLCFTSRSSVLRGRDVCALVNEILNPLIHTVKIMTVVVSFFLD